MTVYLDHLDVVCGLSFATIEIRPVLGETLASLHAKTQANVKAFLDQPVKAWGWSGEVYRAVVTMSVRLDEITQSVSVYAKLKSDRPAATGVKRLVRHLCSPEMAPLITAYFKVVGAALKAPVNPWDGPLPYGV